MIVLDTDLLTIVQRAQGEQYTRLRARLEASDDPMVCVTMVSLEEQLRGWLAVSARARAETIVVQALARLRDLVADYRTRPVLDYDDSAAEEFQRLRRERVRIGTMDLRIGAIALVNDALLLSRNLKDFRKVPGLRVEDWTSEIVSEES